MPDGTSKSHMTSKHPVFDHPGVSPFSMPTFGLSVSMLIGLLVGLAGCGPGNNGGQGAGQGTTAATSPSSDQDKTTGKTGLGGLDFDEAFSDLLHEKKLDNPPRFTEISQQSGIPFRYYNDARQQRYYFPEILGGGIACLDYDLDGRTDTFFANGRGLPLDNGDDQHFDQLYRCVAQAQFQVATEASRIRENRYSHGVAFGDLNCDGFDDIAVAGFATANDRGISIFLNQGDGTFLQVADQDANVFPTWSTCPLITDLTGDGIPDLIVVNYVGWTYNDEACNYEAIRGYCGPGQFQPLRNYVFVNDGQGGFPEKGESLGFTERGKGLAIAAVDFDQDLSPEIYIANDLVVNYLYSADKSNPGKYRDIGGPAGVAVAENGFDEASMSVTPADFDRNGFADLFVTNYYKRKNTLYLNRDGSRFQDVSFKARTHATGELFLGFGALPLDFDRDGWMDLFIGNGHVLGPEHNPNQMTNQILRNEEGVFQDVSSLAGSYFQVKTLSRGSVLLDLDQDLDSDIIINHIDRPVSVLRNDSPSPLHSIGFELVSPEHLPLEGSRIDVKSDTSVQTIPISSGGSYLSDPERKWIVGTGQQQQVDVTVHWRDGRVDQWDGLATDRYWRFAPGRKWSILPNAQVNR